MLTVDSLLDTRSRLLEDVEKEILKLRPMHSCVVDVDYPNGIALGTQLGYARARFLYQGKPVPAYYLILHASSNTSFWVGFDEQIVVTNSNQSTGLFIQGNDVVEIQAKVSYLTIKGASSIRQLTINGDLNTKRPGGGVGADGNLAVYAWCTGYDD